jgi:hypothetical protein
MNISSQHELMCGLRLLVTRPWLLNAREAKYQTTVTMSTLIIVTHARSCIVGVASSIIGTLGPQKVTFQFSPENAPAHVSDGLTITRYRYGTGNVCSLHFADRL